MHTESIAAGYFFGDLLIATPDGALVARPRATVFATGAHDGVLADLDDGEIVLVNDNNFPAGGGRPGAARDATEFIRLKLTRPLCEG